jgi:hypothetical protein
VPKQNRPIVRDGRLQVQKRTDRSYLNSPSTAPSQLKTEADEPDETLVNPEDLPEESGAEPDAVADVIEDVVEAQPAAMPSAARLPASVRALQQQGVRKRREVDVDELARADTRYALHELRRICILAALIIISLIVAAFVLR